MTTKKNELAVTETLPAYMKNIDENDTRGNENITKDDLVIPRLNVIQALSPEIKKNDPMFIEGAEQGMLFNTVTRELYKNGVTIIPVTYEMQHLVWRDRKLGGGFGGSFETTEDAEAYIVEMAEEGWEAVDTPTHLCLMLHDNKLTEIAIAMPKSKAKVSRQFNSVIRMIGGPRFSRAYKFLGAEDKNNAGEDFWNVRFEQAGYVSEPVFKIAEKLYEDLLSGEVKYNVDQDDADTDEQPKEKTNF